MSAPASSRRALLKAGAVAIATGGTIAISTASTPDPVLAFADAERRAWVRFGEAGSGACEARKAFLRSEWNREPRVQVAEYTSIVRGPDLEPIPPEEWIARPIYLHTHADIDRDCRPGTDRSAVEERRARLHRQLDEDAALIAAAPEKVALEEAERLSEEAHDVWRSAVQELVAQVPTTAAGLIAVLDRFEAYTDGCLIDCDEDGLTAIFRSVRVFLAKREA